MNLRLTVVSGTYFPQLNGVSRSLDKLVGHCLDQGDQVQLIVPHYAEPIGQSKLSWSCGGPGDGFPGVVIVFDFVGKKRIVRKEHFTQVDNSQSPSILPCSNGGVDGKAIVSCRLPLRKAFASYNPGSVGN
jgi:hypothetical protein